jgi:hypothetical protein
MGNAGGNAGAAGEISISSTEGSAPNAGITVPVSGSDTDPQITGGDNRSRFAQPGSGAESGQEE